MRLTLRSLAALLGYPSAELSAHTDEIRRLLEEEAALPAAARRRLEPLLRRLEREDLLELQSTYSELFDRSRALSLHLFEHVHGESRERGQAMIDLGRQYMEQGYLLETGELPDFVPVFIEFCSCLPPEEAREMLAQPAHVFAALDQRLSERGSDYAPLFQALILLGGGELDAEALSELQQSAPSDDPARIDEEWEEAPVNFSQPAHEMGGPTGVFAKMRAAALAVTGGRDSGGRA